jgi:hypothetical protein
MDKSEKLLMAASSVGLLVELNTQIKSATPRAIKLWPGLKMSLYSGTLLWLLGRWLLKRKQLINVSFAFNIIF